MRDAHVPVCDEDKEAPPTMSSEDSKVKRTGRALTALVAAMAALVALAAPASAASGKGEAVIILADHAKGRTLSGQGVKLLAGAPATKADRSLTLPVSAVDPDANAAASADGSLSFKHGKKSVELSGLRFNLSAGTLRGILGGSEVNVFQVAGAAGANAASGAVSLNEGRLRLTADAAKALRQKLGLERALRRDGVGMAWLAAKANPAHAAAQAVASGVTEWGVLASWRAYVLGQQGPPMSKGTIAVEDGATANGNLSEASAFFAFPASGGSYEKGLYGAADKLTLKTQGTVKFAKPFHCIVEIKLAGLELVLDDADSALVVGDYGYDIDEFNGMGCNDKPAVLAPGTKFATLDSSAVSPTYSADGKTVTWSAIPAALTAAAAVPFAPTYKAGQPLDPITITVALG
jgi:Htaa